MTYLMIHRFGFKVDKRMEPYLVRDSEDGVLSNGYGIRFGKGKQGGQELDLHEMEGESDLEFAGETKITLNNFFTFDGTILHDKYEIDPDNFCFDCLKDFSEGLNVLITKTSALETVVASVKTPEKKEPFDIWKFLEFKSEEERLQDGLKAVLRENQKRVASLVMFKKLLVLTTGFYAIK